MPTYVYECKTCEKSFEVEQRITADALTDCDCGGQLRRVIQPVGISFKGSGFYVNDSASKPTETKSEAAKPVESTPAPATEAPAAPAPVSAPAADSSKSE